MIESKYKNNEYEAFSRCIDPIERRKKLLVKVQNSPIDDNYKHCVQYGNYRPDILLAAYKTSVKFIGYELYLHWKGLPDNTLKEAYNEAIEGDMTHHMAPAFERIGVMYTNITALSTLHNDTKVCKVIYSAGASSY